MKGCRKPKKRFDGNSHDALSDIQAFVFLLGRSRNKKCKGEDCLERKKQKRVTLRMLCSETIEQLSETIEFKRCVTKSS